MGCFLPADLPTPLSWYYLYNNHRRKLILMTIQPRDNNLLEGLEEGLNGVVAFTVIG